MTPERAFAILGPDTVALGHCGEVIQRIEKIGKIVNAEMRVLNIVDFHTLMQRGPRRGRVRGLDQLGGQPVLCLALEGEQGTAELVSDSLSRMHIELLGRYFDLFSDKLPPSMAFVNTNHYAPTSSERAKYAIDVVFHGKTFEVPETVPHLPDPKDTPLTNLGKLLRPSQFAAADDKTLAILKPDTVIQHHCGEILQIAENVGNITALRMIQMNREQMNRHLGHVAHFDDFKHRIQPSMELPMIPFVLRGPHMIGVWRAVSGPTNSADARAHAPETIRALYGTDETRNVVHGSGNAEEAAAEIQNFFTQDQIFENARPPHKERRLSDHNDA